ncbi:MAG TPA: sigma-70 family RNA polymerase sigma factor [Planctomycetota bacterium]|nr:sigma-70 family RNA polymerase sigma factor [Planctomycetota bacterium]
MSTDARELLGRCIDGDPGAWEEFVRRTRSAILRGATVALRKFRAADRDTLENVQQQVYVELLRDGSRTLRTYRGESDLEGWVAVIAMRTAYRVLRQRKPEAALPELLPAAPTPAPGEAAERTEFLNRLHDAFRKLDPREGALLRLSYFEKMSYKEIASALGMPLNSVSPLLLRAKEKLKKLLE